MKCFDFVWEVWIAGNDLKLEAVFVKGTVGWQFYKCRSESTLQLRDLKGTQGGRGFLLVNVLQRFGDWLPNGCAGSSGPRDLSLFGRR